MIFRKQRQFRTEDPKELARQLVALEESVDQAFRELQAETYPRGKVYQVRAEDSGNVIALIGSYYECDTSRGSITLKLETPRPEHRNTFLIVEKTVASGTVTLLPIDSQINSSTQISVTSANAYRISCNGVGYRREF